MLGQQRNSRLQLRAHPIVKGERDGPAALTRPGALTRRGRSQPNHTTLSIHLRATPPTADAPWARPLPDILPHREAPLIEQSRGVSRRGVILPRFNFSL